jgi:hypothetical protein
MDALRRNSGIEEFWNSGIGGLKGWRVRSLEIQEI